MQKAEFNLFQTVCGPRKIIMGNMSLTFSESPNHILLPKTSCQKVTRTIVCHYCGPVVVVLWCYCSAEGEKKCYFLSKAEFHLLGTLCGPGRNHCMQCESGSPDHILLPNTCCNCKHVYRLFVCVEQSSGISDNLRPNGHHWLLAAIY